MRKSNGVGEEKRVEESRSALDDILREGAREMLQTAVEVEVADYVDRRGHLVDEDGRRMVVRNGHQPPRTIQSGLGDIEVRRPRVHDRSRTECFTSRILPPYMRRTPSIEALIPVLYRKFAKRDPQLRSRSSGRRRNLQRHPPMLVQRHLPFPERESEQTSQQATGRIWGAGRFLSLCLPRSV